VQQNTEVEVDPLDLVLIDKKFIRKDEEAFFKFVRYNLKSDKAIYNTVIQ
jgi:hypothetical protein